MLTMLGVMFTTPAFSQVDFGDYAIRLGEATTEIVPDDQWYVVYNSKDYYSTGGGYFWDGYFGMYENFGYLYSSSGPDVVASGMFAEDLKEYLVRFLPVDVTGYTAHDTYYVQFADGNYVWVPSSASDWVYTYPNISQAAALYVYRIEGTENSYAMNGANAGNMRLYSWGSGWIYCAYPDFTGDVTSSSSDYSFRIYPVELYIMDEREQALTRCINAVEEYLPYSGTFTTGTGLGCYDADAVAAFEEALLAASECYGDDVASLTADDLNTLADNLIAAYEAVVASRIPRQMEIKEGYYWICRGADYYDDDEVLTDMGIYVYIDTAANVNYALYTALSKDDATFLWQITDKGNLTYEVMNMATHTTFDDVDVSNKVTMSSTTNTMTFDYEYTNDQDEDIFLIRQSTRAEDGWYYLWGSGMKATSNSWVWAYRQDTYEYCLWRLIEVDDATAQEIIESYSDNYAAIERYNSAIEMQETFLTKESVMPSTQIDLLGELYTNLTDALAVLDSRNVWSFTEDEYEAILSAYNAFMNAFVDPTELLDLLGRAEDLVVGLVIGTDPGTWTNENAANELSSTLTEANAYYAAGSYTQEKMDEYVSSLTSQIATVAAAVNLIQEGKWYELRYATLEEIETNGWDSNNGAATESSPSLYGKYVCLANISESGGVYTITPMRTAEVLDVCVGEKLYFANLSDMSSEDIAKFRFIAYGDSYIVQNKATGLFLKTAGTSGEVTLSLHPSLFEATAIGYGENILSASTLAGDSNANLCAQLDMNILTTASDDTAGSNCGFYIEDSGESVESRYEGTEFNFSAREGAIYAICYPVSITSEEGTLYGVEVEGTEVTLLELEDNTAAAGQPCVLIYGELDDYSVSNDYEEIIIFSHGYDIAPEALTEGQLVGNYYSTIIGTGKGIASGNSFTVSKSLTSTAEDNTAYIDAGFSTDDNLTTTIGEGVFGGEDAIADIIAGVTKSGNIYSIDGKLLGKGNINTARRMGTGLYIVNGVKVVIR